MCFRWIQLIIWFYFWQEKGVINAVRGFSSWFFLNSPHFHAVLGLPFKPQIGKIVVGIISYEVLGSTKNICPFEEVQAFVFLFSNSTEFSSMFLRRPQKFGVIFHLFKSADLSKQLKDNCEILWSPQKSWTSKCIQYMWGTKFTFDIFTICTSFVSDNLRIDIFFYS